MTYKLAECDSENRHTSLVRPSEGHGVNVYPWMPFALWNQFVATDYLCQRLLSDVTLNRLSKGIHSSGEWYLRTRNDSAEIAPSHGRTPISSPCNEELSNPASSNSWTAIGASGLK